MKKALFALLLVIAAGLWWSNRPTGSELSPDSERKSTEASASRKIHSQLEERRKSSIEVHSEADTARTYNKSMTRSSEKAAPQNAAAQEPGGATLTKELTASQTSATHSSATSQDPAIGTVRVLGHRGCDLNTQGWFLSTGRPDQYDFKVSDDGNSLVVEPIVQTLDGNFEFVHCVGASEIVGKRVRFTARIKTDGVSQTAQIRLRGENLDRQNISGELTKVGGTHDWKDFSVDVDVKPEVVNFSYGLTFRSEGKLWISAPKFEVLQ